LSPESRSRALSVHERPLTRVEVVTWVALTEAWMRPDCPARCPNVPERARLRVGVERVRKAGLVGVIDARDRQSLDLARKTLQRYDAALSRLEAEGVRGDEMLAIVSAMFMLVLHDQPPAWAPLTDALFRVDRKIVATFDTHEADACRLAELCLAHIRHDTDEAFEAWLASQHLRMEAA
jgi:hypothetical protein